MACLHAEDVDDQSIMLGVLPRNRWPDQRPFRRESKRSKKTENTCAVLSRESYQQVYTAGLESSPWVMPAKPKEFPSVEQTERIGPGSRGGKRAGQGIVWQGLDHSHRGKTRTVEELQSSWDCLIFLAALLEGTQEGEGFWSGPPLYLLGPSA